VLTRALREFIAFGLKQAYACIFGGALLAAIIATRLWYPTDGALAEALPRYDFLFWYAIGVQLFLLVARLESLREAGVIVAFHLLATAMEVFKTSDAIRSWNYPGAFDLGIGNVPLFAGFMYSAVGSYIARVWRVFDFRFSGYPAQAPTLLIAALIYLNFFSHHFVWDLRWALFAAIAWLWRGCWVHFKVLEVHRRMPLLLGWTLVALFIWFAENLATWGRVWLYPSQVDGWHMVPLAKLGSWFLLMILSFVLVSLVHRPRPLDPKPPE
jgi:uncharacterized membrane protein YoaT (DUF817 family)